MLNSASAKNELYNILNACRTALASIPEPEYDDNKDVSPANNIISDDTPINHIILPVIESSSYFKDNQFLYNARVVDFQNIPARLIDDANKTYNSVFI